MKILSLDSSSVTASVAITENGAIGYRTTFNPLLDFNFKVPSYRYLPPQSLEAEIKNLIANIECFFAFI